MSEIIKISEKSVLPLLEPRKQDLINLIGEAELKKQSSFAIQAVNANSYLAQATPASVAKAIWNVAITGLSLNPVLKLAYLTPRKVGQAVEAILMPSYQGLCKLLTDTGSVKTVYAHCVFEGDEFDVNLGEIYSLSHKPKFKSKVITHVYAVGVLQDGSKQFEVMGIDQINEIRDLSDGYKAFKAGKTPSAIWDTWHDEMARKTVIKRLTKYLPKTDNWEKVQEAIEVDNSIYPASFNQEEYIRNLIETSVYDEDRRSDFRAMVDGGLTKADAEVMIEQLRNNQLNAIQAGNNYSQTDISKQISETIK